MLAFTCRNSSRYAARAVLQQRFMSAVAEAQADLRTRLTTELKTAMKSKNAAASMTLRSVLSEVYTADKMTKDGSKIPEGAIVGLLRKGIQRRADSAAQFTAAARSDLAEKENTEATLLQTFVPPLLPEADIDTELRAAAASEGVSPADGRKALGKLMKGFYARVGRERVDADVVKRRAEALLDGAA